MEQTIKWHYIAEEGLPKLKDNKPHTFLICDRIKLSDYNNEFLDYCTIALIQKKEEQSGFAYTPAMQFYWGPDIFNDAYAWAELPKTIPFKEKAIKEE